jgi:long-subunit acyl-CoA synthetase (AMP-forming)
LVPSLVIFLSKAKIVDKYDLSSVKMIYCGAAPLSEKVETLLRKRLGLDSIMQGYGLTETTLTIVASPPFGGKSGSVGLLVPGIKCKVNNLLMKRKTRKD